MCKTSSLLCMQLHQWVPSVHTELSQPNCQHHCGEQMPVLLLSVVQNQKTAGFGACKYTYGFLLCIHNWLNQAFMHCITVKSKVPVLWLTAVVQIQKIAGFGACNYTYASLLCIEPWQTQKPMHCITVGSKVSALWLIAAVQTRRHQCLVHASRPISSAVDTELAVSRSHAQHHCGEQSACRVAECCAESEDSRPQCCNYTYGILLCILTYTESDCKSLHHSERQNACPVADCCAEPEILLDQEGRPYHHEFVQTVVQNQKSAGDSGQHYSLKV